MEFEWFRRRGAGPDALVRLPGAGHHRHRRRQRRLVPQHLGRRQLLGRVLAGLHERTSRGGRRVGAADLHRRLPRQARRLGRGHGAHRRLEHGLAQRARLHAVDRLAGAEGRAGPGRRRRAARCTRPARRRASVTSATRRLWARWRTRCGTCCAPRRAATSTGARPGCRAATPIWSRPGAGRPALPTERRSCGPCRIDRPRGPAGWRHAGGARRRRDRDLQ